MIKVAGWAIRITKEDVIPYTSDKTEYDAWLRFLSGLNTREKNERVIEALKRVGYRAVKIWISEVEE